MSLDHTGQKTTDTKCVTVLELWGPDVTGPVLCSPKQLWDSE